MSQNSFLIFPHQLYNKLSHLKDLDDLFIYLIEEPRYFTDFSFHKLKLAYHRATMKKYYDKIKKSYNVKYIEFDQVDASFYKSIKEKSHNVITVYPGDFKLENKLEKIFGKKLVFLDNVNFLIKLNELDEIKKLIYKNNKYSHDEFYKYQRKKLDILMDSNKPVGGKWSFDTENRLALPPKHKVPGITKTKSNKYIKEAINYVNKHFPDNYGSLDNFIYPIDSSQSKKWLDKFLEERLKNFGPYEDAVSESEPFIYHSVLSPMMNIGLITDQEVVETSYSYYQSHKKTIPIQSFEGFIRQVIGWRNYVYTVYLLDGKNLFESNFLKHKNELNEKFWTGETGIKPIDSLIQKIVDYSYVHHIERLMYLGNFMLICLVHPKEVYRIFMEWTIDAYDWVMVPNVFGMSQYADGGTMMTRPYFSSSNYIDKMSTYKKSKSTDDSKSWSEIWDALYYNFIAKHRLILKKNYAISRQVKHWDNKTNKEQEELIKIAKKYLTKLFD